MTLDGSEHVMKYDNRCCGDHLGVWDTEAEPGQSFCRECLTRIEAIAVHIVGRAT